MKRTMKDLWQKKKKSLFLQSNKDTIDTTKFGLRLVLARWHNFKIPKPSFHYGLDWNSCNWRGTVSFMLMKVPKEYVKCSV